MCLYALNPLPSKYWLSYYFYPHLKQDIFQWSDDDVVQINKPGFPVICRGFFNVQWVEVRDGFVDIAWMVHHHCLHFLFIKCLLFVINHEIYYFFEVTITSVAWSGDE